MSSDLARFSTCFYETLALLFGTEPIRSFGDECLGSRCGSDDLVHHLVMTLGHLRGDFDDEIGQLASYAIGIQLVMSEVELGMDHVGGSLFLRLCLPRPRRRFAARPLPPKAQDP